MLWVLALVAISLGVCQEMCARMGAVTGKGLADLIREEYGVRVTMFAMSALLVANFATTVSEFAGLTAAILVFAPVHSHWVPRLVVPLVAGGIWLLVTRGNYKRLENVLLTASLVYIAYILSAFLARPPWGEVARQMVWPVAPGVRLDTLYVFMVINVIGTTITPWGLFYLQSSVRDKGTRPEKYSPIDPLFGAFAAIGVAFFIMVCCGATLYKPGVTADFQDAGQVARALQPAAGSWATILFAIGLFNASCYGAITVPLSTAYAITESLGWESGVGRRIREAPLFIGVFTFLIVVSVLVVLMGGQNLLTRLILLPNLVGGVLLPVVLVLMLRLINNRRLMGNYTNSRTYNIVAGSTTIALVALSLTLFVRFFLAGE
jgi:Mn2+/Fe2+ NRAMP family transporter